MFGLNVCDVNVDVDVEVDVIKDTEEDDVHVANAEVETAWWQIKRIAEMNFMLKSNWIDGSDKFSL